MSPLVLPLDWLCLVTGGFQPNSCQSRPNPSSPDGVSPSRDLAFPPLLTPRQNGWASFRSCLGRIGRSLEIVVCFVRSQSHETQFRQLEIVIWRNTTLSILLSFRRLVFPISFISESTSARWASAPATPSYTLVWLCACLHYYYYYLNPYISFMFV